MSEGKQRLAIGRRVRGAVLFLTAVAVPAQLSAGGSQASAIHDIVYAGARAIDPETGLDAVRNIAVDGDRIVAVSAAPLKGRRTIDARGLVAAPGFIDIHSHATTREAAGYQAKQGRELLNYGTSVGHTAVRYFIQKGEGAAGLAALRDPMEKFGAREADEPLADAASSRLSALLEQGLGEGAIGIGSGTQYAPGISRREMLGVTAAAARSATCLFTHIRHGSLVEPDSAFEAVQESVANAAATGACVHVAHINSMAMRDAPFMAALIADARRRGIDITTETYPWGGSVDAVRSHFFDPGWERRWGVTVGDLQSRSTGKRLTQAAFDALRAGTGDDGVIMHMNSEPTIVALLRDPSVMVASDGGRIEGANGHPRSAGTFARLLGHYVRETKTIDLSEALRKITLLPAQRLEAFVPAMTRKGRLQPGMDADIVLFDPRTVGTRATYGDAARYSDGFHYVMVNGVFVVDRGKLVDGVSPGRPVSSKLKS